MSKVDSLHRAEMCYAQNRHGEHIAWMAQAVSHQTTFTADQARTRIKNAVIDAIAAMYDEGFVEEEE